MKKHLKPLAIIFLASFLFQIVSSILIQNLEKGWYNVLTVTLLYTLLLFAFLAVQYLVFDKRQLAYVSAFSGLFWIFGAMIDDDPKSPNVYFDIWELLMMVILTSASIATLYAIGAGVFKLFRTLRPMQSS